jgi:hypothetical protein
MDNGPERISADLGPLVLVTPCFDPRAFGMTHAAGSSNVLGLEACVGNSGLTLSWQRPARSNQVVVVRRRGAQGHGGVVFRGEGELARLGVRPCTAYHCTIDNYDRRGRGSTGVPTTVLNSGCT